MATNLGVFLHGGAFALSLLLAFSVARAHGGLAAQLGAAFAAGVAAYVLCAAAGPATHKAHGWLVPLQALAAGNNVVFFLFAGALFDDEFRLRPWHAGAWLAVVAASLACASGFDAAVAVKPVLRPALAGSAIVFAALGGWKAVSAWSEDLVQERRRLRVLVVAASALYIALNSAAGLAQSAAPQPAVGLISDLALLAILAAVAGALLRADVGRLFALAPAASPAEAGPPAALAPADGAAIAAIDHAMRVERLYRRDGLTVGGLAAHLGMPEHRLRRIVNRGLGHRNFNAFLNGWRIDEAREALADPAQADVPVLTIALDAGFGSLGPFNRAFKAQTGMTPTEYRRVNGAERGAPADSEIDRPISRSQPRGANSARNAAE